MLGHDALGRLTLGQISRLGTAISSAAGSYVVSGHDAGLVRDFEAWFPRPFDPEAWTAETIQRETWTLKIKQAEPWVEKPTRAEQ